MINLSYFFSRSSNRVVCQGVKHDSDSGWVLDGNSIARSFNNLEILLGWGVGVVEELIFGSRNLHFRIPRSILGIGTNFQLNLTTLEF